MKAVRCWLSFISFYFFRCHTIFFFMTTWNLETKGSEVPVDEFSSFFQLSTSLEAKEGIVCIEGFTNLKPSDTSFAIRSTSDNVIKLCTVGGFMRLFQIIE